MDVVNVAVMAPILGRDLSWLAAVDTRVRVLDANDAAPGGRRRPRAEPPGPAGPAGPAGPGLDRGPSPNDERSTPAPGELDDLLAQADVLLVGFPVPPHLAGRSPRLVWAHHTQAGVSNLLATDLWTSPVTLTSSRGTVMTTAIAEYVVAAAAYFARGLHEATRQKQAGALTTQGYRMLTLRGATMGIIGLGGIGQEVARMARAMGMRVVGTRRSVTDPQSDRDGADLVLPAHQLGEVAAQSDFLVICSQLTAETRGMIDAAVFSAMKPSAVLINIARGEEVDEEALVAAIGAGRLRGAVLDVYAGELDGRPPRPELVELPQILLTPHISGSGDPHAAGPLRDLFARNMRRFLAGEPLLNVVDRQRGY